MASNPSSSLVVRQLVPNVVTTLSVPFSRNGAFKLGGRATIVRLRSGALAVFSPVDFTPEVKQTVATLGDVKYISAMDIEHHMYLGPWHKAYPSAKVLGPEGLPEKRQKQKNEAVPFAVVLTTQNKDSIQIDPEFDAEFEVEYVHSHANKEIVFNHKPTGTLIEADLMFNLPANEQYSKTSQSATSGILTRLMTYFSRTHPSTIGQQRLIWYGTGRSDRQAFGKSMHRINSWTFDRIIPCHGDVIETGGKKVFQSVMQWYLEGSKKIN